MTQSNVLAYINAEKLKGTSNEVIKQNLISQGGWTFAEIDEAFANSSGVGVSKKGAPVDPIDPALLQYRKKMKSTYFMLLSLGALLVAIPQLSVLLVNPGYVVVVFLLAAFMGSSFAVKTMKPAQTRHKSIVNFFMGLLIAAITTTVIGGPLFFVSCLYPFLIN